VRFYEYRGFRPLWMGDTGLLPQADALLQVISQAGRERIKPTVYHLWPKSLCTIYRKTIPNYQS
jgi:hypothetical protein